MYNKIHIGQNAAEVLKAPAFKPISKVVVLVDDKNEYVSGDDTGRTLEVTCPYGSQAMADDLLTQLKGYVYQPMTAQDALLDPAAEIGDGVTVGGVYTILAQIDTMFDMHCAADIAAPGEEELETEYVYQTPKKRLERQLAKTRSLIAKTAEQIRLEVAGVEDEISYIQLDLESITGRVQDAEGNIATLELTATRLQSEISGKIDGDYAQTLIDQSLEGFTLSVSNSSASSTINLMAGETVISSQKIKFSGMVTFGDLDDPDSGTVIDGALLRSGTVVADYLIGKTVALLDENEEEAGWITIGDASSANYRVELESGGALYLKSGGGAIYLESNYNAMGLGIDGITVDDHFYPMVDGVYTLGADDFPWADIYAENSSIGTSDRNKKHDIFYDLDKYDALFDLLQPAGYKLNRGTSGRTHIGMIAQDVEEALEACELTGTDFAGFVKFQRKDGSDGYGLRLGEFIGLLIDQVQKLKGRVAKMEGKNSEV